MRHVRSSWLGAEEEVETFRIARRLSSAGVQRFGLVPASTGIDVARVAARLGHALAELSGAAVAIVTTAGPEGRNAPVERDETVIGTWLGPRVALLEPTHRAPPGRRAAQLLSIVTRAADKRALILVDLSGLDDTGEQLAVIDALDATSIVARAGATRGRELLRCHRELGASAGFGVLMIDA